MKLNLTSRRRESHNLHLEQLKWRYSTNRAGRKVSGCFSFMTSTNTKSTTSYSLLPRIHSVIKLMFWRKPSSLRRSATFNFRKVYGELGGRLNFISVFLRLIYLLLFLTWSKISSSTNMNNPVPGEVFPVGVPLFERWAAVDRLALAQTHQLIHAALHLLPSVPDPHHAVPTGALSMGHVSVLHSGGKHGFWVRRASIF